MLARSFVWDIFHGNMRDWKRDLFTKTVRFDRDTYIWKDKVVT